MFLTKWVSFIVFTHNPANEYAAGGAQSVAYDAAGNLTLDQRGYTYYYDYENHLIQIKEGASVVAEYTYDALGRRVEKAAGGVTTRYYYDSGWRVLAEYLADDVTMMRKRYVYGNYLDEVLLVQVGNSDYYYAHDHLCSPVALLSFSGGILERYEYDAYGRRHVFENDFDAKSGSSYGLPIAFTGQRLDVLDGGDLQVMYYKNRYYDVEMGRFLTRDPIDFKGGSLNLYQYVQSMPIYATDPMGLIDCRVVMVDCDKNPTHLCCPHWLDAFGQPDYPNDWEIWLEFKEMTEDLTIDKFPKRGTERNSREYRENFARDVMALYEQYQSVFPSRCCNLDACTLAAQWMHESSWGASQLAQETYNLGSIKGTGPAGSYNIATGEHINGEDVVVKDDFRDYNSLSEFMNDYTNLICENDRYKDARNKSGREYYEALKSSGYATDPKYVDNMMAIHRQLGCH